MNLYTHPPPPPKLGVPPPAAALLPPNDVDPPPKPPPLFPPPPKLIRMRIERSIRQYNMAKKNEISFSHEHIRHLIRISFLLVANT